MLEQYETKDYAHFRTSPEIIAAIDAISDGDIRDPDGEAWRVWEFNEREFDVLNYIRQQGWQPKTLVWCGKTWAQSLVQTSFRHVIRHAGKQLEFDCASEASLARARSALTKEPGTIAWIDGFERQSRFWDIGANIGTFALYAAIIRNCQVTAFEPAAANFAAINRNILANNADKTVRALPVAIDSHCHVSDMQMRDNDEASALHTLGANIDYTGASFTPSHLQGALAASIDSLVSMFRLPVPHYVKIDVDGLERAVISGGRQTFADRQCRSVLVELDLNDHAEVGEITSILNACGMRRDENVSGNIPRDHGKVAVYNMIFRR